MKNPDDDSNIKPFAALRQTRKVMGHKETRSTLRCQHPDLELARVALEDHGEAD